MTNNLDIETTTPFQNNLKKRKIILLSSSFGALFLLVFLCSCADHSARNQELLAENYRSLSDDNLLLYYYQLEDQIEVVERRKSKPSFSLGFGLGSFGHSGGGSAGVGVSTGGNKQGIATDLRDRRNEVKLELQHRGITP